MTLEQTIDDAFERLLKYGIKTGPKKDIMDKHKEAVKGYASVIDSQAWSDTDTDIGSPGGQGRSTKLRMKYCGCRRGKQLEKAVKDTHDK